jgi:hypothetical protein
VDTNTGKKKYRHIHWGRLDDNNKFYPGKEYIYASPGTREQLIFPESWDMSEVEKLSGFRKPGRPYYDGEDRNRLYGDIWLLEQVAAETGIRQDIEKVFEGNSEMADAVLTLAMFPYLTGYTYNRLARWQSVEKSPCSRLLTSAEITRITQGITEKHRMALLKLRAAKLGKGEILAVDSTTRSAYGDSLSDIRWGKNKDRLPLPQTTETICYTLDEHMPVYYRTFPGNMPDSRSLVPILRDLEHAGFKDVVLVTDRGYESVRNLEKYILDGLAMIMCTKVRQGRALEIITAFGSFDVRPDGMDIDKDTRLYYKQYDLEYEVKGAGKSVKPADRLRLNLYFDPVRRSEELVTLDIDIKAQEDMLAEMLCSNAVCDDDATLKHSFPYFLITYERATRVIESYSVNEKKVAKARRTSGFFAVTTHKLDMTAPETCRHYRLRDEQEKCFQQMKSQMVCDRQRNWSEEGKTGRLFILFVSMILGSYVRHVWKSTQLHKLFSSSLEILDEMRTIRCIEHTNRAKVITPFVGAQLDICEAFCFEIPKGCAPEYTSRHTTKQKRGRPKKALVERDV